VNTE